MLNVKPLSQLDSRWANKYVGFSRLKFSQVGCTITVLTCLLNYLLNANMTPDEVNEKLKAVGGFSGALILWGSISKAFPEVKWTWRGYNYDNIKVAWNVYYRKLPVMVEVNNKGTKHWVLFVGDRKMIDPLATTYVSTNKYPLTGYSLIERKV